MRGVFSRKNNLLVQSLLLKREETKGTAAEEHQKLSIHKYFTLVMYFISGPKGAGGRVVFRYIF